mgnify:CR=1 FL=1
MVPMFGPKGRRAPRVIPRAEALERRSLLTTAATWFGQDGSDLVDHVQARPNSVQDIHIGLTGLPNLPALRLVDVRPLGGGRWRSDGQSADYLMVCPGSSAGAADLFRRPFPGGIDPPAGLRRSAAVPSWGACRPLSNGAGPRAWPTR